MFKLVNVSVAVANVGNLKYYLQFLNVFIISWWNLNKIRRSELHKKLGLFDKTRLEIWYFIFSRITLFIVFRILLARRACTLVISTRPTIKFTRHWHASGRVLISDTGCMPQIETGDPGTCAILIPAWGSNWGYSGFSREQNNRDSSGAYVLRSEREDKHAWNAAWRAKFVGAFCCLCFRVHGRQKTQIPPIGAPWLTTPLHGAV